MDFFKSVFSDEPRNPKGQEEEDGQVDAEESSIGKPNPREGAGGGGIQPLSDPHPESPSVRSTGWGFGSVFKTITARSEQVIESYRRDLDEFRVGLTQETSAAARALAATLPVSLDKGAAVAQESLESVGQAIDVVFRNTADIISHGKEALLSIDRPTSAVAPSNTSTKKITRFEMQLHVIQSDQSTYCEDPDDVDEFNKWKSGFCLLDKGEEIEELLEENGVVSSFFAKLVPQSVHSDAFWTRYFFRLYKLNQVEEARAHLVKRAISAEEEDLSWEIDDDDTEEELQKNDVKDRKGAEDGAVGSQSGDVVSERITETGTNKVHGELEGKKLDSESGAKTEVLQTPSNIGRGEDPESCAETAEVKGEAAEVKGNQLLEVKGASGEKVSTEDELGYGESSKDGEFSVVPDPVSAQEEEEIGWDEIEDLGSSDEKKMANSGGSPNKVDIRKRLTIADDDEDLSWDIEDDDDAAVES